MLLGLRASRQASAKSDFWAVAVTSSKVVSEGHDKLPLIGPGEMLVQYGRGRLM